jgi:hypothetical protein
MTSTTNPPAPASEAQLRELLVTHKGLIAVRELDGLVDRYAADALVGRRGAVPRREGEARRGRWT